MFRSVLVISDQHFPYNHPDIIAFLKAIASKYKPDKIVNIGDEIDGHSISFHEKDPDLMSPSDELQTAINRLQAMYKLFPEMDLVESNHGSLVYRRARFAGLPKKVVRDYADVIEAPKGWKWHNDLILKMSDGHPVYFCHGKSADVLKMSQAMGMSCVQGHFHEKFEIRYWGNKLGLYWGMTVGCLIDNDSLAFSYNKINLKRPLIGCGLILDGHPKLLPMVLDKSGRWVGKLF
jgi:UDP-2,3-diacylglucosamine pyrophosphatase LpxH